MQTNHLISTRNLIELSPQQGVDCGYNVGCNGCSGGLIHKLFNYFTNPKLPKNAATLASYPYKNVEGACSDGTRNLTTKYGMKLQNWKGYYNESGMSEYYILEGLKTGVVGGAVACDQTKWYAYKSGIMTYKECYLAGATINHAINIVGYGSDIDGIKYWIISNCWSTLWGEDGFIKLERVDPNDSTK